MDLNPILQNLFQIVASVLAPVLVLLLHAGLRYVRTRWKFSMSQQTQAAIEHEINSVVGVGVGWGRAKLASGAMGLGHVTTGNPHIDQISTAMLAMLSAEAKASDISADDLSRRIVAGIGHALGDDPMVPSVGPTAVPVHAPANDAAPSAAAAAA